VVTLALLLLELVQVLFGAGGDAGIVVGEDAYNAGCRFLVDDNSLVVFAHDLDTDS
jgi:hypothetical protein